MSDSGARLLRLLGLLQRRPSWSGTDLAERLGVDDRTVRRDIERLRDLGYQVESTRGAAGGYRLGV
ncbi:MAG: helix-turn-helix domain-containing protein, partial [Acidimicrobiaceae bacterium]|nr:helix-turn-helix domain-containing protein [Acidimicrobiaceae bacterium]